MRFVGHTLLHLAGRPSCTMRPAKHFGLTEELGKSLAVWNETHGSLLIMRILHLNENADLTRDLSAPESEPISDPKIWPAPESELLDRLFPGWQLRLHDDAVIDHILEVINTPRKPYRSHASRSTSPRRLRPGVRGKTASTLTRPRIFLRPSGVRVMERHSNELAAELVTKLGPSSCTADMRKVPVEELKPQIEEVLRPERVTAHQDGPRATGLQAQPGQNLW